MRPDIGREAPDGIMERHEGDEPAACVGQWCCGCPEHPVGKPWGWAHERWEAHYERCPREGSYARADVQGEEKR